MCQTTLCYAPWHLNYRRGWHPQRGRRPPVSMRSPTENMHSWWPHTHTAHFKTQYGTIIWMNFYVSQAGSPFKISIWVHSKPPAINHNQKKKRQWNYRTVYHPNTETHNYLLTRQRTLRGHKKKIQVFHKQVARGAGGIVLIARLYLDLNLKILENSTYKNYRIWDGWKFNLWPGSG